MGHNLSCVEIRILYGQLVTSLSTLFGNTRKCAIEQRQVKGWVELWIGVQENAGKDQSLPGDGLQACSPGESD